MRDSLDLGVILCQPSSPLHLFSLCGVGKFGWLGPPLSSILANLQAGAWDKGQPLQMRKWHVSYVLSSMFLGLCIPNLFGFVSVLMFYFKHPKQPDLILTVNSPF
jgi:hypothetical protein